MRNVEKGNEPSQASIEFAGGIKIARQEPLNVDDLDGSLSVNNQSDLDEGSIADEDVAYPTTLDVPIEQTKSELSELFTDLNVIGGLTDGDVELSADSALLQTENERVKIVSHELWRTWMIPRRFDFHRDIIYLQILPAKASYVDPNSSFSCFHGDQVRSIFATSH